MDKNRSGLLILRAIPSKEAEDLVVAFLLRYAKNVSPDQLAEKIKKTPLILSRNISEEKGIKLAKNLKEMGAMAEFELHPLADQGSYQTPETFFLRPFESKPRPLTKKKPRHGQKRLSPSRSRGVIIALVSIFLIATLSMLAWQLYRIIAP
jgi:hypothetical protein